MREVTIEQYLIHRAKQLGGLAPKWVSPGTTGVPDRLVLLPGGQISFIELKAPGKHLEPMQTYWAKKLADLGFYVGLADSHADVEQLCRLR